MQKFWRFFVNSDNESEYECQESDSDSDSEELNSNLVAIENPESEDPLSTDEVPGPFEDAGVKRCPMCIPNGTLLYTI